MPHAALYPLLLCLALTPPATAQTVYKSVEEGVVTFSDTRPSSGDYESLVIDLPPAVDDGLLERRLAAMRDTTDRMAADRRERERHRAELRALDAPPASATAGEPPAVAVTLAPGFWPSYLRPNWRPVRPTRPVVPPGWSVMRPGNHQLMRPVVSSREARRPGPLAHPP